MRLLSRLATNSRPRESIASEWSEENAPGPVPGWPHCLMNLPVLSNFTMRSFVHAPWPSATKMSPLLATTTSEGALKCVASLPFTPGVPSVISFFPSLSNFCTVCPILIAPLPRPSPSTASVTQIFSSASTKMPCGKANIPLPKLLTSLPEASNFRIGSRFEPTQVFEPQRSTAQTLLPSGAISTPAVEPHWRPPGICAQLEMDWYGLGRLFVGWLSCAAYATP